LVPLFLPTGFIVGTQQIYRKQINFTRHISDYGTFLNNPKVINRRIKGAVGARIGVLVYDVSSMFEQRAMSWITENVRFLMQQY
jgi:hypothetical protein